MTEEQTKYNTIKAKFSPDHVSDLVPCTKCKHNMTEHGGMCDDCFEIHLDDIENAYNELHRLQRIHRRETGKNWIKPIRL